MILVSAVFAFLFGSPNRNLQASPPPDPSAFSQLIRDADFWEEQGNTRAAILDLKRALDEDPVNEGALIDLGILQAEDGDGEGARKTLARLVASHPHSVGVQRLDQAIHAGKIDSVLLSKGRLAVQMGHYHQGIRLYQRAFHGAPLHGYLALEYDQAMSAIPEDWKMARKDLEAIRTRHPDNPRVSLVLGETLIIREKSRRNGIRILSDLVRSGDKTIAKKALSDWRSALIWLHAMPDDRIFYEAYLALKPVDMAIRRRLAGLPFHLELDKGYVFLKRNDLRNALYHFERAMKDHPEDGDVAGAIGIVRLRQRRYEEAVSLFRWSLAHQGNRRAFLKPLEIARTEYYLQKGRRSLFTGNSSLARADFRKALALSPKNPEAYFEIGATFRKEKKYSKARRFDRNALSQDPDFFPAAIDLVETRILEDQLLKAQGTLRRFRTVIPKRSIPILESRITSMLGQMDMAQGRSNRAMEEYSQAAALSPDDPWIRADMAKILLDEGHRQTALATMEVFLRNHPDIQDGWFADALVLERAGRFRKSRMVLAHIPYKEWTPAMKDLSVRLSIRWFDRQAGILAKKGDVAKARQWETMSFLIREGAKSRHDPALDLALARLSALSGDYADALLRYESLIRQDPSSWSLFREALGWAVAWDRTEWVKRLLKDSQGRFRSKSELNEILGDWSEKQNHWKKALVFYLEAVSLLKSGSEQKLRGEIGAKIKKARTVLMAREFSHGYVEVIGGETVVSQGSQFYMGEIGGFVPLSQSISNGSLLNPPRVRWGFRWILMGDFLHYPFSLSASPGFSSTEGAVSLNGANAGFGVRGMFKDSFLDLLVGPSWGETAQTAAPFKRQIDWYAQVEYAQNTRWGFLDLYGNYVGILQYLYGQARFLTPLSLFTGTKGMSGQVAIGPELIVQGNNTYNDGQIGGALRVPIGIPNASVLFDGGLLRSNLSTGYGGYEGTYVDFRF